MAKDFKPGKALSGAEAQALSKKLYELRKAVAARTPQGTGPLGPAPDKAAPSEVENGEAVGRFHGNPASFIIGRNNFNNRANGSTCGTGSRLAEPAAANEGPHVYYTGNLRHQEFSTNGGVTYTCAAAYPAGPLEAPIAFGDTDVIYDHSRGVTFHSVLYVNSALTNGVVRVFVRRNIPLGDNCSYTFDFDPTLTNVLPDYPHLGLSNDFLYLTVNRLQTTATGRSWLGATIQRNNLDQLADCVTAAGSRITFGPGGVPGQRILVPGHAARNVMYLAWVDTPTQWRVFSWADNSGTVFSTFVSVAGMSFTTFPNAPDCRGGTNNANWADALTAHIVGFNVRTAIGNDFVTAWTTTTADAAHPRAHIHGAVFRIGSSQTALTLVQQPVIFFSDRCAGISIAGANDRGDLGMAIAIGGRPGGGGPAVTTAVGMKDQFNPGPGGFSFIIVAAATHNPTRYGDYFTVRRNSPCGEFFSATGYSFLNGTALANINARYVEFGRGRDAQCYFAWRNAIPAT